MKSKIEIEHAEMVERLAKPGQAILDSLTPEKCHTWHMGIGIASEAGELAGAVKAYVAYNKPIDRENVIEELGDLEFFLEGLRESLQITREVTLAANLNKLRKRYSSGYSDKQAIDRADKVEVPPAPIKPIPVPATEKNWHGRVDWMNVKPGTTYRAGNQHFKFVKVCSPEGRPLEMEFLNDTGSFIQLDEDECKELTFVSVN